MLDIFYENKKLIIRNSDKKQIIFNTESNEVFLDEFGVNFPGEYEKNSILLEVKKYKDHLYYNFLVDGKHIVIITNDNFEITEEISDFFGDIDILIIIGTKDAIKIFDNIESKIVIPYGESKDIFLQNLGQHIEELDSYKQKGELPFDTTEFVNLKIM